MSTRRLLARVPSAIKVDTGRLEKHELRFHKIGNKDGTAKCDATETGNPAHYVHGVLFHIAYEEKTELDRIEGSGNGYEQKDVVIRLNNGVVIEAYTYYATHIDPVLKPLDWYKEHVLTGARENGLPEEYICAIGTIESIKDIDLTRRNRELSIYR
jgi:hypothetical protein